VARPSSFQVDAEGATARKDTLMDRIARPTFEPTAVALLIGAPLLMSLGRLLLVPFDDQGWGSVLTHAAAHQTSSDVGWLLAMAASGLLCAAALSLARMLHVAGSTRAAAFAGVSTALGWAGSAGICAGGLLLSYMGKAPNRAVQVKLLTDFNAGHSFYVFLLCVLGALGYVVLAVGLARSGLIGKGAASLVAIGGVGTLLTMPGPLKALLVTAALVLFAGQVLVVRGFRTVGTSELEPMTETAIA